MPLPNGLYQIAFRSAQGTDYGVAYMQDGRLRGGDSGMAYVGSYEQDGDLLTVRLSVTQHRAIAGGIGNILGYPNIHIEMAGIIEEGRLNLRGTSQEVPSVRFEARLSHLAD